MILYIEDDSNNRMLVKRLLDSEGIEFVEAIDSYEGLRLLQEKRPELILMDINMPGMNGYELTTKIKSMEEFESIPIIALTVASKKGEKELAIMSGCDGFIAKPIDVDNFVKNISEYMSGKKDNVPDKEKTYYLKEYSRRLVARLEEKIDEIESSRKEWEDTFNAVSDLIFVLDRDYIILKVNNAACEYFGLVTADILGEKFCKVFTSFDLLCPCSDILDNVKEKMKSITGEMVYEEKDSILLVTVSPILDGKNNVRRLVHLSKDITSMKKAQKEIEDQLHDLEVFRKVSVGRELKMIELKERIAILEEELKNRSL